MNMTNNTNEFRFFVDPEPFYDFKDLDLLSLEVSFN